MDVHLLHVLVNCIGNKPINSGVRIGLIVLNTVKVFKCHKTSNPANTTLHYLCVGMKFGYTYIMLFGFIRPFLRS